MSELPNNSIDLVIADPPYNIGKDDWDNIEHYLRWSQKWITEVSRVLKRNGSFYCFHNQFPVMTKLQDRIEQKTGFVFKRLIVWNKRFKGAINKDYLDGFIEVEELRNYQKMVEYILFYTLQDEYGNNSNEFGFKQLRNYFKNLQNWIDKTKTEIMGDIGQKVDHCFRWGSSQWDLPTKKTYKELKDEYNIKKWGDFKPYSSLKQKYNNLEYTFNNQKTHHSVWNYEIASKEFDHLTPKPLSMIGNIIKHSSNRDNLILDPFMGSGTTGLAARALDRKYIGFEQDKEYYEIAKERVSEVQKELV